MYTVMAHSAEEDDEVASENELLQTLGREDMEEGDEVGEEEEEEGEEKQDEGEEGEEEEVEEGEWEKEEGGDWVEEQKQGEDTGGELAISEPSTGVDMSPVRVPTVSVSTEGKEETHTPETPTPMKSTGRRTSKAEAPGAKQVI